jgi:hypothetical protein
MVHTPDRHDGRPHNLETNVSNRVLAASISPYLNSPRIEAIAVARSPQLPPVAILLVRSCNCFSTDSHSRPRRLMLSTCRGYRSLRIGTFSVAAAASWRAPELRLRERTRELGGHPGICEFPNTESQSWRRNPRSEDCGGSRERADRVHLSLVDHRAGVQIPATRFEEVKYRSGTSNEAQIHCPTGVASVVADLALL